MAGQFQVDPAALKKGSAEVAGQYAALVRAIRSFQSQALDVDGAFGFLGPSVSVLRQYEDCTEKAFGALDQLARLLMEASEGLATTAENYARADGASSMTGG